MGGQLKDIEDELEVLFKKASLSLESLDFKEKIRLGTRLLNRASVANNLLYSARACVIKGFANYQNSNINKAVFYYEKAKEEFELLNNTNENSLEYINCFNSLGILYKLQGDFWKSMKILNESLVISEELNIANPTAFNNIGVLFFANKKFKTALRYYEVASNLLHGNRLNTRKAKYLGNMADTLLELNQLNRAEELFKKIYRYHKNNGNINSLINVHKGFGKIALVKQQYNVAEVHLTKAIALGVKSNFRVGQVRILLDLSKVYSLTSRIEEEEQTLHEAIKVAKELNRSYLMKSLHMLVLCYERKGLYKKAIEILEKSMKLSKRLKRRESEETYFKDQSEVGKQMFEKFLQLEEGFRATLEKKNRTLSTVLHERKKVRMRMEALQNQLKPGYIFSTLQDIQSYALEGDELSASDYVADFANLMRRVLRISRQEQVSLKEELEVVKNYVRIELRKTKKNFPVNYKFSSTLEDKHCFIPPFLLLRYIKELIKEYRVERVNKLELILRGNAQQFFAHVSLNVNSQNCEEITKAYATNSLEADSEEIKRYQKIERVAVQTKRILSNSGHIHCVMGVQYLKSN